MTLVEITKNSYEEFLNNAPFYSPFQNTQMASLLSKRGYQTSFIALENENKIQVAGLLYKIPMTGGLHMEINCGPVSLDKNDLPVFYKELKKYAKDNGALELVVKPYETYQSYDSFGEPTTPESQNLIEELTDLGYSHDGLSKGYPGGEPDWHYVKDISQLHDKKDFINSISKKAKPLLKKANTFGIKLKKLSREELSIFKSITEKTSERREYQDKSLSYYEDFYDSFQEKADFMIATINFDDYEKNILNNRESLVQTIAKFTDNISDINQLHVKKRKQFKELNHQLETFDIRLKEAKELKEKYGYQDIPIACALFIFDFKEAVYLFSGSLTEFNKFYAPVLLQEYAITKAISLHIPVYNFLGITGYFDGSDGVLRFKQNFNGYINRKMGTFRYYPSPLKFKFIQFIKKLLNR